jgi:hypothetical protein
VQKNSRSTLVKASINPKIANVFNRRWVKYSEDGTYEDKISEKGVIGTWTFEWESRIKETRPGGYFSGSNEEIYFLNIKLLNDTIFSFVEEREHLANDGSCFSTLVVMK